MAVPVQLYHSLVLTMICYKKGPRNPWLLTKSFKLLSAYKSTTLLKSLREGKIHSKSLSPKVESQTDKYKEE